VSWIYIIAVIIFAILSNVNKAGKEKSKQKPRGAMPTFGGGGLDTRRSSSESPESDYDTSSDLADSPSVPSHDYSYDSGEGTSMEQPGNDSVESRLRAMQQEFERLNKSFDKLGGENGYNYDSSDTIGKFKAGSTGSRADVQSRQLLNGLMWAEILSPPRSVSPHHSRK